VSCDRLIDHGNVESLQSCIALPRCDLSSAITTKPNDVVLLVIAFLVTKVIQSAQLRAFVTLLDFVFFNDFAIAHQSRFHLLWIDDLHKVTHENTTIKAMNIMMLQIKMMLASFFLVILVAPIFLGS
jgi:hypothetical protein